MKHGNGLDGWRLFRITSISTDALRSSQGDEAISAYSFVGKIDSGIPEDSIERGDAGMGDERQEKTEGQTSEGAGRSALRLPRKRQRAEVGIL